MKNVTWYIFNVLGKKKHVSPTFLEAGFEWHMEAYPNGIDDTCKGCGPDCASVHNSHLSGLLLPTSRCSLRFFSIGLFISAFPGFHTVLAKGCDAPPPLPPPLLLLPPLPFARAAPEATSQRNVRRSSQPRAAAHLADERGG